MVILLNIFVIVNTQPAIILGLIFVGVWLIESRIKICIGMLNGRQHKIRSFTQECFLIKRLHGQLIDFTSTQSALLINMIIRLHLLSSYMGTYIALPSCAFYIARILTFGDSALFLFCFKLGEWHLAN